LRFSTDEAVRLVALRSGGVPPDGAVDDDLRRALADTETDVLVGRAWLAGRESSLRARLAAMPRPVFPLRGRDLRAAGLPQGPALGEMLARVRQWWMAGGCVADKAACRAELARLLTG
jgi:hypothetical protein